MNFILANDVLDGELSTWLPTATIAKDRSKMQWISSYDFDNDLFKFSFIRISIDNVFYLYKFSATQIGSSRCGKVDTLHDWNIHKTSTEPCTRQKVSNVWLWAGYTNLENWTDDSHKHDGFYDRKIVVVARWHQILKAMRCLILQHVLKMLVDVRLLLQKRKTNRNWNKKNIIRLSQTALLFYGYENIPRSLSLTVSYCFSIRRQRELTKSRTVASP